ncbi:hypothetical protein ACIQXG_19525 [Lysinibacillus sphaericus]|uniref:hypothetical protein n=1 Tax=Lysinibacillus sphaericus TaxID=1421 RepID=UPI0037F43B6C
MEIIDSKKLNDTAEQIVKELASRNIRIADLDTVIEMVKEKVNKAIIVNNDEQKAKVISNVELEISKDSNNQNIAETIKKELEKIFANLYQELPSSQDDTPLKR